MPWGRWRDPAAMGDICLRARPPKPSLPLQAALMMTALLEPRPRRLAVAIARRAVTETPMAVGCWDYLRQKLQPRRGELQPVSTFATTGVDICYNRCLILLHCTSRRRNFFATIVVTSCYNQHIKLLQPIKQESWKQPTFLLHRRSVFLRRRR